jgi:hypothetical protein
MWSIVKTAGALAVVFTAFGAGTARASTVEVKVPFPFLVRGQALPAGRYLVERDGSGLLEIRGEKGTRGGAFVLTSPAGGHDPAGEKPALTFTRHETAYQLSTVWESGTDGRTVVRRHPKTAAD